ncbi:MAG: MBL fold metallo-hydrolase [Oceanipulchritudo sp.]
MPIEETGGTQKPAGFLYWQHIDTVILETTRGATARRASRASEMERLLESIEETTSRGGSILIPTFALGRMQELITVLHTARKEGRLRNLPVFVSGLGIDLLNQFDRISRGNSSLRIRRKMMRELGAIKLPGTHRPGRERPSIYLLSSGMMVENTPSYNAASALLSSPRNTIAFVGYCDPETPGGRLLATPHGEAFLFKSLGKSVQVLARIGKFDLSSHADREELLDFAQSRDPRRVVLTHGDPEARAWFQEHLGSGSGDDRVINPFPLQAVKV